MRPSASARKGFFGAAKPIFAASFFAETIVLLG
jgi:hypothetical protein